MSPGRTTNPRPSGVLLPVVGVALLMVLLFASRASVGVPDVVRIPRGKPTPGAPAQAATFSHWEHGSFRCFACHPGLFPQAPRSFTHADMNQGRFCGGCHDGRSAHAPSAYRCEVCHAAR